MQLEDSEILFGYLYLFFIPFLGKFISSKTKLHFFTLSRCKDANKVRLFCHSKHSSLSGSGQGIGFACLCITVREQGLTSECLFNPGGWGDVTGLDLHILHLDMG